MPRSFRGRAAISDGAEQQQQHGSMDGTIAMDGHLKKGTWLDAHGVGWRHRQHPGSGWAARQDRGSMARDRLLRSQTCVSN